VPFTIVVESPYLCKTEDCELPTPNCGLKAEDCGPTAAANSGLTADWETNSELRTSPGRTWTSNELLIWRDFWFYELFAMEPFWGMSEKAMVPPAMSNRDPLWRMRAYRVACELVEKVWKDAEKLRHHQATEKVSGQLYAAVGSIAADLGEGYSHSSGRDRARIFEYALGSTRKADQAVTTLNS
jgi:hypothetical protein